MHPSNETDGPALGSLAHSTSQNVNTTDITTPDTGVVNNAGRNGDSLRAATANHPEVRVNAPIAEQRRENNQTVQHKLTKTQLFVSPLHFKICV